MVLETLDTTKCSSDHEIVSSKYACDEDVILADLARKCKRKKGLEKDKKKKGKDGIMFKVKKALQKEGRMTMRRLMVAFFRNQITSVSESGSINTKETRKTI